MSESKQPLKDREMDYGTSRKSSEAAAAAAASSNGQRRSLTPPPCHYCEYSDPPPPYESLNLDHQRTRRHSCPPDPTGIPYLGIGRDFYDAGDYHQLTACIVLSCLVFWLFNPLFGIVAFIVAGKPKCN